MFASEPISTTYNLFKHGVLHYFDMLCSGGYGLTENVDHLFLNCGFYGSIWPMILLWLGFDLVHPGRIIGHLLQFRHLRGSSKKY